MLNFDRTDRRMKNFNEMTARLGIDLPEFARENLGYALVSAIRRCRSCDAGEVCRDWLVRADARLGHAPAFCPNAPMFDHVLRHQARPAGTGGETT